MKMLMIGGPYDGEKMEVPDGQKVVEVYEPKPGAREIDFVKFMGEELPRAKITFYHVIEFRGDGKKYFVLSHRNDAGDVLERLIDRYHVPREASK